MSLTPNWICLHTPNNIAHWTFVFPSDTLDLKPNKSDIFNLNPV